MTHPKYRYILNLDGFASAFIIIKELYYNSILIIPASDFTDIICDILIPWKHYIPCNFDLSNLVETVKWCNSNLDQMEIILKNMITLRDKVISLDNILNVSHKLLTHGMVDAMNIRLTDCVIDTNIQKRIRIPIIPNDTIHLLNKKADIQLLNNNTITYEEQFNY